ncbi:hypothetical protein L798_02243 [Zootermopsis nevadensis]|uniref:Uncharacterized protein n=1 Tax=Zootermopsis nevadensis TaxID=136037 RepID=A0A067QJP4_ZOONE|nr:hypothetical protein L798_02243 [Zootermopsis nevadensis]
MSRVLRHSCTLIPGHLRNSVFPPRTFLALLINNGTMTNVTQVVCVAGKKATYERTHKLFFAHVRARRTPNNSISFPVFQVTALLNKHVYTYFKLKYTFPHLLLLSQNKGVKKRERFLPGLMYFVSHAFSLWTSHRCLCVSR